MLYTGIEEYEYTAIASTDMKLYEGNIKDLMIMPSDFKHIFLE